MADTPLADSARTGTRLETLKVLRNRLAVAIDNPHTAPRDLAALSKQMVDVLAEIEALEPSKPKEATPLDILWSRREASSSARTYQMRS